MVHLYSRPPGRAAIPALVLALGFGLGCLHLLAERRGDPAPGGEASAFEGECEGDAREAAQAPSGWTDLSSGTTVELPVVVRREAGELGGLSVRVGVPEVYRWSDGDWIVEVVCRIENTSDGPRWVDRSLLALEDGYIPWAPVTSLPGMVLEAGASVEGTVGWYRNRNTPRPEAVRVRLVPPVATRSADPGYFPPFPVEPLPVASPETAAAPPVDPPAGFRSAVPSEVHARHEAGVKDLAVGNRIEVEWNGSWWNAEVLAIQEDGLVKVHYLGWDVSHDESVPVGRICQGRPAPSAPTASTVPGGLDLSDADYGF